MIENGKDAMMKREYMSENHYGICNRQGKMEVGMRVHWVGG